MGIFTKLRKAIITKPIKQLGKLIVNNPGIAQAAGAVAASSFPGAGSSTIGIGASLGSGVEAALQHRHLHSIQKEGEIKIEAKRIEGQADLKAQIADTKAELSAEHARIAKSIAEITKTADLAIGAIENEEIQLNKKEAIMIEILDHIEKKELSNAVEKITQLDNRSCDSLLVIIRESLSAKDFEEFERQRHSRIENIERTSTSSSSLSSCPR